MHKIQNEEELEAPYYIMCNEGPVMRHTAVMCRSLTVIESH